MITDNKNVNLYGEVFTPIHLVEELLEQLPPSVWRNSSYKWLDPCAGKGVFGQCILVRLMKCLAQEFPEPVSRKRHILTKMLYMVEINKSNIVYLVKQFGKSANIREDDFLSMDMDTDTVQRFNVIIANPPYQSTKTEEHYIGSQGMRTLWDKFLIKSFKLQEANGYLAYITPSNWRRPEHPLYRQMCVERKLVYLHIHNKADGLAIFNAQTRFDMYVIQNTRPDKANPIIIDEKGVRHKDIDPRQWPFLPNYAFDTVRKYLSYSPVEDVIYNSSTYDARHLSLEKSKKFKWPIVHTLGHRNGIGFRYAEHDIGHFGTPKVILNVNEKQYPVNDYLGEYGMSQLSFGIPISPQLNRNQRRLQGEKIIKIVKSPDFEDIISATKWGSFQTDYRMFKYLRI